MSFTFQAPSSPSCSLDPNRHCLYIQISEILASPMSALRSSLTPLLPLASSSRLGASLLLPPPSSSPSSSSFAPPRRSISDMHPRYPGHIPLTPLEKVVLTIGSAGAALLNPRRAGTSIVPFSSSPRLELLLTSSSFSLFFLSFLSQT